MSENTQKKGDFWKKRPPQEQFTIIYALMMIGDLMDKGLIEGPIEVNMDNCHAALAMIEATGNDVQIPPRRALTNTALKIMRLKGVPEDHLAEIDQLLMFKAEVNYR